MIKLTQLLITGATVGLIYGLMAVGFVLIYKASRIFNFAQGEMVMVGAFLAWTFLGLFNLPLIVGLPLACIITAAVGYSLERFPFRPMIGQPILATIMITMAIAVFLPRIGHLAMGQSHRDQFSERHRREDHRSWRNTRLEHGALEFLFCIHSRQRFGHLFPSYPHGPSYEGCSRK